MPPHHHPIISPQADSMRKVLFGLSLGTLFGGLCCFVAFYFVYVFPLFIGLCGAVSGGVQFSHCRTVGSLLTGDCCFPAASVFNTLRLLNLLTVVFSFLGLCGSGIKAYLVVEQDDLEFAMGVVSAFGCLAMVVTCFLSFRRCSILHDYLAPRFAVAEELTNISTAAAEQRGGGAANHNSSDDGTNAVAAHRGDRYAEQRHGGTNRPQDLELDSNNSPSRGADDGEGEGSYSPRDGVVEGAGGPQFQPVRNRRYDEEEEERWEGEEEDRNAQPHGAAEGEGDTPAVPEHSPNHSAAFAEGSGEFSPVFVRSRLPRESHPSDIRYEDGVGNIFFLRVVRQDPTSQGPGTKVVQFIYDPISAIDSCSGHYDGGPAVEHIGKVPMFTYQQIAALINRLAPQSHGAVRHKGTSVVHQCPVPQGASPLPVPCVITDGKLSAMIHDLKAL